MEDIVKSCSGQVFDSKIGLFLKKEALYGLNTHAHI